MLKINKESTGTDGFDFDENTSDQDQPLERKLSDNSPAIKINVVAEEKMANEINSQFYTNDQLEEPEVVTTNFRSPILQKIYTYIDSTEISIFDHELVKARNKAIKILNVLNGGADGKIDLDKLRQMAY